MPHFSRFLKASAALALVVGFATVTVVSAQGRSDPKTASGGSDIYRSLNLFGDVFEQVRANYVDPVEDRKLVEYALNGMLANLDPHSAYMTDEETQSMAIQNRGEFGGLGIEVTMENGLVKVVSPIDDTPAARAGMQSGDMIVEIDGEQVMGMSLSDAVNRMRGKVGTDIVLTVVREGAREPMRVKITRDTIKIRSVRHHMESGNVGYIRITTFNAQTFPGLKRAFEELEKEAGDKIIGYVLDLRNNPGGLLDQAILVSDAFLDRGEIVSTRGRTPEDIRRDMAQPGDLAQNRPVVVLINGGSASASEIVAGALQDHKRGIVMGTQSFGKGSVQTLFNVPGGGSIRLTTARYYTPSGTSIQAKGITPDIVVEQARVVEEENKFPAISEADLRGALKNPNDKDDIPTRLPDAPPAPTKDGDKTSGKDEKKDEKDGKDEKTEKKNTDYQLARAIDLIQGISIYKQAGATPEETPQPTQGRR